MPDDQVQNDPGLAAGEDGGAPGSASGSSIPARSIDDRLWLRRTIDNALTGPASYYWRFIGLVVLAVAVYLTLRWTS